MNLTPWDCQSKRVYDTHDIAPPLYTGDSTIWGGQVTILVEQESCEDDYKTIQSNKPKRGVL